jgi:hypothetical protein
MRYQRWEWDTKKRYALIVLAIVIPVVVYTTMCDDRGAGVHDHDQSPRSPAAPSTAR